MRSKNAITEPAAQEAGRSHDSLSFHKNMVHDVPRLATRSWGWLTKNAQHVITMETGRKDDAGEVPQASNSHAK